MKLPKPIVEIETQTLQSDGFYEQKMNEYVTSLKELSNQVVGMKNEYTNE